MATRLGKVNREGRARRQLGDALPAKMGSVAASRIDHAHGTEVCSFCFPHGIETPNSTAANNERSWKRSRKTPYRR